MKKRESIDLPEGVSVDIDGFSVKVKGKYGEVVRDFYSPIIKIKKDNDKILLEAAGKTDKRRKMMVETFRAHIRNLIRGANEGFTYKLKICSGHFPMSVSIKDDELIVKNFLGEKVPRRAKILVGVKANIDGSDIIVSSTDREKAGQTCANIERATIVRKRDRRVFQDGIYIYEKPGKVLK